MASLHNRVNRKELRKRLMEEPFRRTTLSFYRYVILDNPKEVRDTLYREWEKLGVFGRIYVAHEGINAQLSVPEHHFDEFKRQLYSDSRFGNMPFKIAVEDNGKSFFLLAIKVKKKIVADGLNDGTFDVTNVGTHLSAAEFNKALEIPGTLVVDMRNYYESEVGHFENAVLPQSDTFKEELPIVLDQLKGKEEQKILMYCTGGVRCEKASAWLRHHGFRDVSQLHGGIIEYARQVKQHGLQSKFIGKNFVFDERKGERITDDVIAHCHQCQASCDEHVNCANPHCHLLFIQCASCAEKMLGCCSEECADIMRLSEEERRKRVEAGLIETKSNHRSRVRPKL
ncbi:MAG: hypothetical protein FD123_1892 [Bacteroidetes bacterium]|nr:MAG: hypothetical protein FD123_1892 [Bacteroidota bacterium]